jgi:hypothetical protein
VLVNEAILLADLLDKYDPSRILDCGSGRRVDRTIIQPWIAAAFDGYDVVWTDIRPGRGVLCCDFTKPETLERLPRAPMVTCMSLLEHVEDLPESIKALASLVERWLIVAVPCKFPRHDCPIDNGWRPSPEELGQVFTKHGLRILETFQTQPENFSGIPGVSASIAVLER